MISTILSGRTGNWLFQVAAAYVYSLKHNMDYCVPHDKYDELFPKVKYNTLPEVAEYYKNRGYKPKDYFLYCDPRPHKFAEIPKKENIIIDGYWQSYKYYEGYHDKIRALFDWEIKPNDAVSIHVRRGDYLEFQEAFPVIPVEYYTEAINAFAASGLKTFMVFSDDIEWCKQNLKGDGCMFFFSEGKTALEDMMLMSGCAHHIIANSSFSQWAALMNPSPDKIVIAPHPDCWYGERNRTYARDMCPPDWITIKYSLPKMAGKKGRVMA